MEPFVRIGADTMGACVAHAFECLQVPRNDAMIAADVLVRADLRGVESHGINSLFRYVDGLRSGRINPSPQIATVRESPSTAVVDGDGGMGLVVGVRAMEMCMAKAEEEGLAVVAVRRSRHFGMASYYSLMCLPRDMIGLSLTNNAGTCVVPTFGRESMFSTNPISITAPACDEPPFELDMATSVIAGSKIPLALAKGEKIPFGCALDVKGQPTDDPKLALDALKLLPLGGSRELGSHKGYGLAVAVDILTGVLAGGMYGNLAKRNPPADEKLVVSSSHFFAALRIDLFRPADEFKAAMDDMLRALKGSEKATGHDRIYTPGEMEFETEQDRLKHGIPYHPVFVQRLRDLASEFGFLLDA